jgi:hypothetical protein
MVERLTCAVAEFAKLSGFGRAMIFDALGKHRAIQRGTRSSREHS